MRSPLFTGIVAVIVSVWGTSSSLAEKKWRVYEGCTLIENPANDGDSFHVRVNKRHYIFRLYWVDTPEAEDGLPERTAEQAQYFGLSPDSAVRYGKEAMKFSHDFLKDGFKVYTKFADAMGRSDKDRDYAIIEKDGKFLHIELARAGLARIHGFEETDEEEMPSLEMMRMRLKTAENEAKTAKRGAWSGGGVRSVSYPPPSSFSSPSTTPAISTHPSLLPSLNPSPSLSPPATGIKILPRSITVLDVNDPTKALGVLRAGAQVQIIGTASPTLMRIKFKAGEVDREGLCQRVDLGL